MSAPLHERARNRRVRTLAQRGRTRPLPATAAPVTVISDNCWGGEYYREIGAEYATPFVGVLSHAPCYVRLLSDLPGYLAQPLVPLAHSRYQSANAYRRSTHAYPMFTLGGDVELHFYHYDDAASARAKWTRRVARMNWDQLRIEMSDRDHYSLELAERFLALPYRTLLLTARRPPRSFGADAVWVRSNRHQPHVVDGATLFPLCKNYVDLPGFLSPSATLADRQQAA